MKKMTFFLFLIISSCNKQESICLKPIEPTGSELEFVFDFETGQIDSSDSVKVNFEKDDFLEIRILKKATGYAIGWTYDSMSFYAESIEFKNEISIIRFEPSLDFWEKLFSENRENYKVNFSIFTVEFE